MGARGITLSQYVARQLFTFYPDREIADEELAAAMARAQQRHERCFRGVGIKGATVDVDPTHTDHYAAFLYFLANALYRDGNIELASKVYGINKALHALDIFYEVELPDVFAFQHPVGTVLGRGKFSDYLFVYQRCSVGSNLDGVYPTIAEGVVMFGGSSIIGACSVGPNTWISVGALVMDEDVPGNCVVFGSSPNLVVKPTERDVRRDIFRLRLSSHVAINRGV